MNVSTPPRSPDAFTIERHGGLVLISASPALENLDHSYEQQATELLLAPLRSEPEPNVVFDLSQVRYFGSMFLAVMLRCWKHVKARGGTMVLAGVSPQVKDLLRVTALDMIWAIYPDRRSAMEALLSD
ncbi:MAG: STAS domain-containing protein [Isosphaeraceae bacterium]